MWLLQDSKIRYLLLFFALYLLAMSFQSKASTLILVSDPWPPYTDVEGKNRRALDLVEHALAQMKVDNSINIASFSEVLNAINTNQAHGSAALWSTPERRELMLFSEPYLHNQMKLASLDESVVEVSSLSALSNARVGIIEGYAYGQETTKQQNITWVKAKNLQENLSNLVAKKVDYVLVDELVARELDILIQSLGASALFRSHNPMLERPLHLAIRKDLPGAERLINQFNQVIDSMIENGTYNQILKLSWMLADIDQDGIGELVSSSLYYNNQQQPTDPMMVYNQAQGLTLDPKHKYIIDGEAYSTWGDAYKALDNAPKKQRKSDLSEHDYRIILQEF